MFYYFQELKPNTYFFFEKTQKVRNILKIVTYAPKSNEHFTYYRL